MAGIVFTGEPREPGKQRSERGSKGMYAAGVYAVINMAEDKAYIGSSVYSLRHRMIGHRTKLRNGKHSNRDLQEAWDRCGGSAFVFCILEEFDGNNRTESYVRDREQHWLDIYRSKDLVYNIGVKVMAPAWGRIRSPETCRRISKALTGRERSPEHRRQLAESRSRPYPSLKNLETGRLMPSGRNLKSLARELGISYTHLAAVVRGDRLTCEGWALVGYVPREKGKPFPEFHNTRTGDVIPAGHSLKPVCQERGLEYTSMLKLKNGQLASYNGWVVAQEVLRWPVC